MEIVIKIPEDVYKRTLFYREFRDLNDCVTTIKALENGIPLPKGHGRLIDENDLMPDSDYDDGEYFAVSIEAIKDAPTIIEADKGADDEQ